MAWQFGFHCWTPFGANTLLRTPFGAAQTNTRPVLSDGSCVWNGLQAWIRTEGAWQGAGGALQPEAVCPAGQANPPALPENPNAFVCPGKRGSLLFAVIGCGIIRLIIGLLGESAMVFYNTGFLESDEIKLVLERTREEDPARKRVPAYCFLICDKQDHTIGNCDLKIGYSDSLYYSGHIGYEIHEKYRGHHFAAKACRMLFDLAKKHGMNYLYITCTPDNWPSRKTCERLGGKLLEIAELPEDHDLRVESGHTHECIYRFDI